MREILRQFESIQIQFSHSIEVVAEEALNKSVFEVGCFPQMLSGA